MNTDSDLDAELRALAQKWERITETPQSPRSLMNVIEYSLGSQRKAEVYVNRLLKYVLDPEEPHGLGTEFLRAFLDGLPDECGFEEDVHDLSDVRVAEQVPVTQVVDGDPESTGYVDLVIDVPNEWFLLIELKFSAADTQTTFYYQDVTHVDDRPKTEYESGHYYLYVHPEDRPEATEDAFSNLTWHTITTCVLEPFLTANAPRYPQRTVTQLRELTDDIRTITGMTDQQQTEREKIALYLDHYEAITDVTNTFDERWDAFTDEWGLRLGDALEHDGLGSSTANGEDVIAFDLDSTTGERTRWWFRTSSSDWGMLFKDGWWRHTDDFEPLTARPDDRNDVRIGFHHRLERNRDIAIGDHTLKLYFRNMGANDQAFIDAFATTLYEHRDELAEHLPGTVDVTGNKRNMLVATCDIRPDDHDTFFDAYVDALQTAFQSYVIDGDHALDIIDTAYRDSIEDVYDVTLESAQSRE